MSTTTMWRRGALGAMTACAVAAGTLGLAPVALAASTVTNIHGGDITGWNKSLTPVPAMPSGWFKESDNQAGSATTAPVAEPAWLSDSLNQPLGMAGTGVSDLFQPVMSPPWMFVTVEAASATGARPSVPAATAQAVIAPRAPRRHIVVVLIGCSRCPRHQPRFQPRAGSMSRKALAMCFAHCMAA